MGVYVPSNQEKAAQLLTDSYFAFINGQNSEALHLANEAREYIDEICKD